MSFLRRFWRKTLVKRMGIRLWRLTNSQMRSSPIYDSSRVWEGWVTYTNVYVSLYIYIHILIMLFWSGQLLSLALIISGLVFIFGCPYWLVESKTYCIPTCLVGKNPCICICWSHLHSRVGFGSHLSLLQDRVRIESEFSPPTLPVVLQ